MLALDAFARNKMQFLTLVAFFGVLSLTAVSFRSKRGDDAIHQPLVVFFSNHLFMGSRFEGILTKNLGPSSRCGVSRSRRLS